MRQLVWGSLALFCLVGTANASSSSAPADPPQCRGIAITSELRELAREAQTDPAKAYKAKHRKVPAKVACESALWRQVHDERAMPATPIIIGGVPHEPLIGTTDPTPPHDMRAVVPVHTQPLREMKPIKVPRGEDPSKAAELNEHQLPRPSIEVNAPDTARQSMMGSSASAPTATGVSFEGVGTGIPGFFPATAPPDTNGRVGASQYVQWTNLSFAIWDKSGNRLYGPAAGNTLFQGLGSPCATHNDGDPVASYDLMANRWVLSQLVYGASPNYAHQCIAVSMTGDATGGYYLYDFVTDASNLVDYPHMAVWSDGYYMAAHIFSYSFIAGRVYVFERDKMLLGQPARMLSANLPTVGGQPQYGFLAADLDSATPPPAGEAEFLIGPDPVSTGFIDSTRAAVTWGTTPTITLSPTTQIPVTPLPLGPCSGRACVPQPSPAATYDYIDDLDDHFMYRLGYRNFGGSPIQESLVATQTGGSSAGGNHDALRWYELRNDGSSTGVPAVFQQSTFDPDTDWRFMGSVAMDKNHDIALGYSKSSTTLKPGLYITGRLGTDAINTMGSETTVQAGGGVQFSTGNRWGDYSSMTLDPIDQCTFWFTSEYYQSNGSWNWATKIASFKYPSCDATSSWGTISGTITSCPAGTPISNVVVSLGNGFAGASDATGHYSIQVPPGTFTASAADSTRTCLSSTPASAIVTVAGGGTVTQNFCMTGTSTLAFNAIAINDAANGNNNGVINLNECVSINLTLKNKGCANETAISANLASNTPGVTVIQANSSYPDMAVDATGTNATPFRIQTSSSFVCGTAINLTLTLNYAGGSKSLGITLPSCTGGPGLTIPVSSLGAGDTTENDRIYRDGSASDCAGKTCPGPYGSGTRYYKSFNFTNSGAATACVTVTINAACGSSYPASDIESVAYLTSYDKTNVCTHYLGDSAIGYLGTSDPNGSYSFNVPAASNFVVIVAVDDPGGTCAQFSGTVSGLYDMTPGPGACCTNTPVPTISAGGPTTFCNGGSVTLTSSAASGNQWLLNGSSIGGATNKTYNATTAGNYTVTATTAGCTSNPSAATAITVNSAPAAPTINAGGATTFCTGGSVTLTSSSASGNQWYLDGNAITGATNTTYSATASGNYTVKTTGTCGTSTASAATAVTVNPIPSAPTINAGGSTTICAGSNVVLTSSSATGNHWFLNGNAIGGATNQQYTATAAGAYTVTATVNGCTSAASAGTTVTVTPLPPTPTINAGGATTFCAGGSVVLTSSSATANQWYLNGTAINGATNAQYTATASGNYTVAVTANGCDGVSAATIVTVNPIPTTPTISAGGSTSFCPGGSVTLTSSSATGNQWYVDGNLIASATNQQYTANAAGNYTVIATVNGCTSAASTPTTVSTSSVPTTPTMTPGGPTTFCAGGSVTLTSDSASGNQWYLNGNAINGATNQQYAAIASGDYTVAVTVSGCSSAQSSATTVTVVPLPATPTISADGPVSFCTGGTVTLTSSSATGNQWYVDGNPIAGETNPQYVATTPGNYTVVVTTAGCSATSAATTVSSAPVPATPTITPGGPTTFCSGDSVTLTSSSATNNQWYLNGVAINGATNQQYAATAAGDYTVIVKNGGCSSAASTNVTVTVNATPATPTINAGGATSFCAGGHVTLTSSSATGNQWYLDGNAINSATNQTYDAATTGNYTVTVTSGSCSSTSAATAVTASTIPAQPTITAGGVTTFCAGGFVSLSSSSASGNQWYRDGTLIGGATNAQYTATLAGNYTVIVTNGNCSGPASAATAVTLIALPATPTITPGGTTAFCGGAGTVTLTSSSAAGNQWYLDGNSINGATNQQYVASAAGNYTVKVTANGCTSVASAATTVLMNATPPAPAISAGGPTTFCSGGSVTLTSNTATGNQWYANGTIINGATSQSYAATTSGLYTVKATANGCTSAASTPISVVATASPAPPTISASGPTTLCTGGSVTLSSSSATGNQWYLNGNAINAATGQTYVANAAGDYSVIVTNGNCTAVSPARTVTMNPKPSAQITVPASITVGTTVTASVASAGPGALYSWSLYYGTITAGAGTNSITFTTSYTGTLEVDATVTNASGCSDFRYVTVSVTAAPQLVTLTSIAPQLGSIKGGGTVTLTGTGFISGATVRIGGTLATNVVRVSDTTMTAKVPAHAAASCDVVVTNPDGHSATLSSGYKYAQQFDPNGDNTIDPADVFYLVSYLFTGGQKPIGAAGVMSGDANGDNVVDPADIFFVVSTLFTGGPQPYALAPRADAIAKPVGGNLTLGDPVLRGDHYVVPVIFTPADGSQVPQAVSISIRNAGAARFQRAAGLGTTFEITRRSGNVLSYIAVFDESAPLTLGTNGSAVVAEVELTARGERPDMAIDPVLTMLSNAGGTENASALNGRLRVGR